jgi:uncharacterized protein DUF4180
MNIDLRIVEKAGLKVLEASSAEPLIATADDIDRVIESCLSNGVRAALLYDGNLPEAFFDLSSGQAGTILQKMRNYGVRLAVVHRPGLIRVSNKFREAAAEEKQRGYFAMFETRSTAREWLQSS